MSMGRAQPLLFPATARHTATVIFVHGLGDTGHGWAGAVENWRRRQRLDEVKFVLPHAPVIPITANWSSKMPGWYDIAVIDGTAESFRENEDEEGITLSQNYFHSLIQKEIDAGIPSDRIVLGGFSQGGAMSLFSGLTAKVKLAGIVALSSYLVLHDTFTQHLPKPELNKQTPVFMAHGKIDQVVNFEIGKMTFDLLTKMGYSATMKVYDGMGHSACLDELDAVEAFLRDRLPALGNEETGKSEL